MVAGKFGSSGGARRPRSFFLIWPTRASELHFRLPRSFAINWNASLSNILSKSSRRILRFEIGLASLAFGFTTKRTAAGISSTSTGIGSPSGPMVEEDDARDRFRSTSTAMTKRFGWPAKCAEKASALPNVSLVSQTLLIPDRGEKRRNRRYQTTSTGTSVLMPSISLRLMPTISISRKPERPTLATIVASGWPWLAG